MTEQHQLSPRPAVGEIAHCDDAVANGQLLALFRIFYGSIGVVFAGNSIAQATVLFGAEPVQFYGFPQVLLYVWVGLALATSF